MPSAEYVNVKMRDRLTSVRVRVDDNAVPSLRNSLLPRHVCSKTHEPPEKLLVLCGIKRIDMHTRNDQRMNRRLGIDVLKHNGIVGLCEESGPNVAAGNPAEQALVCHLLFSFCVSLPAGY